MRRERLAVSLGLLLAVLCLYYRGQLRTLPALLLPVAAHEGAHVLALRLLGARIRRVRLEASGPCILYDGPLTDGEHAAAALAGPAAGFLYALFAGACAARSGVLWLRESADVSLLLSAFNLLPILPLDGGRVFLRLCTAFLGERTGERLFRAVSAALLALLLTAGVLLCARQKGSAALSAGLWLLLLQNEGHTDT